MTPSSMILRALRMLGDKTIGATLTDDEKVAYLADMNAMLESWSLERLMCYCIQQEEFALTSGTYIYSIGEGADFNTDRPIKIVDPCFIRDSNGVDTQVGIIGAVPYGYIGLKSVSGSSPDSLYYDGGFTGGKGTISLYPAPAAGLTLHISSWKPLPYFKSIDQNVILPPGYERAIESNFAIEVAPGFTNASAELIKIARESKAAIKNINAPDVRMRVDDAITRASRSNIYNG